MWREEENHGMENGGVGTNSWCSVRGNDRLKLLEFFELTGCQPGVHHAGYVQQAACWDAEALNGALVGGYDCSVEFKITNDR